MSVGDGIDDGHRAGQGEFQFPPGVGAGKPRFAGVHARAQPQRAGDGRTHRLVAIVADAHLDAALEVDALDRFEKAVHEMLARLLAVGDDVDAGVFLQLERQQRGVVLGLQQLLALETPRRPKLVRFGEPRRFRQTAGDGRRKQNMLARWHGKNPGELCVLTLMRRTDYRNTFSR